MTPVFMSENLSDSGYAKAVGEGEKHLKLSLTQYGVGPIGAIGFNLGNRLDRVVARSPFSAAFCLDENEWQGTVSLQLKIKDIK